jgi:hypothetical protein
MISVLFYSIISKVLRITDSIGIDYFEEAFYLLLVNYVSNLFIYQFI